MLLNLGLTADAAAAHTLDPTTQLEEPPASTSPSTCSTTFSFPAIPFLGTFYNRTKQVDGPAQPAGAISDVAMSAVESNQNHGESSNVQPPALARAPASHSYATRKTSRPKTSYQLAHPAAHAHHKRLKLRPKLLLQLQQVSQTPRPLPVLDILPSTVYLPRLARKFPAMFRQRNGLGPNDLIIVMSELYERTITSIPEKRRNSGPNSEAENEDHREVVATICQMLHEDARLKGKAEICLNFGPVWEATPLPSGSYEFVSRTEDGVQVIRWALRAGKSRRASAPPNSLTREDTRRFTFSVIDPTTRRHPVIASMTRNQLEVHDEYPAVARATNGLTTPSSGMSVVSDLSDPEEPADGNTVTLDDELRTLIIVTGIWVAFREGWSHNFSYGDPISSPTAKSLVSPISSKHNSPAKGGNVNLTGRDDVTPMKEIANGGKRCTSISGVRRSNTLSSPEAKSSGSLSKRSNSTGAAFMERAKRRSSLGLGNRLNRHSMFSVGESGQDIVVSRPPSSRQISVESDNTPKHTHESMANGQTNTGNGKSVSKSNKVSNHDTNGQSTQQKKSTPPNKTPNGAEKIAAKSKRHRFTSLFNIFHRNHAAH